MPNLTIVFHHAGGGHRNAAEAVRSILTSQNQASPNLASRNQPLQSQAAHNRPAQNPSTPFLPRPGQSQRNHSWEVELLDFQGLLDSLDLVRRVSGIRIQDVYNQILRHGWTRFTPQLLRVLQRTIRAYHVPIVRLLREHWEKHPADMVLSVIPHFNREIADSLRGETARTPFVTLITDLADYPPHFWIERESEYIIAGTERARAQAIALGHASDHVFVTSGMVLKPKFYEENSFALTAENRMAERERLGLEADCRTGIVLFGGHGSNVMIDIVQRLDQSGANVQLILICGHNRKLEAEIKSLATRKAKLVLGFTENVEHYMAIADFFIGKPGPGSISEALQFHLPVIVECNNKTLPQERYNAEWVAEQGYGIVVPTFREIVSAVARLIEPSAFDEFCRRTKSYSNRALFEVAEILEKCYERAKVQEKVQEVEQTQHA